MQRTEIIEPIQRRVLIVDDDLSVRESIKKVLQAAGYEVLTVADDYEVVAQFQLWEIDLVLLDLNSCSPSGWDMLEGLTLQRPVVPVIILTGVPDAYEPGLAAGSGALIEKPIEVSTLLQTMRQLLAEPLDARVRRIHSWLENLRHLRVSGARSMRRRNLRTG
jgi:DNA-binding response OmpR family regulator